jgi:hypothetical protein
MASLNVTPNRPYNKKIGPFYLKWFRRGCWYVWFRNSLFMACHRTSNLSRRDSDMPMFKLRIGRLSVDYDFPPKRVVK